MSFDTDRPVYVDPVKVAALEIARREEKRKELEAVASLREAAKEVSWLAANPDFAERPASVREFVDKHYLDIKKGVRAEVLRVLVEIFGEEPNNFKLSKFRQAIATGGIGWGKSTVASIALCYMVHWLLCLKDPQDFFNLLPGSRIAAMMMSTSEKQARQVIFSDIKARIDNSPWFKANYPYDPKFRNQIRFSKDIWIIPGDSSETTFEGYNILCFDEKAEILTEQGWRRYDEVSVGDMILTLNHDTGMTEWKPMQRLNVFPAERRTMTLMEGSEFSCLSTPDHRWPVTNRRDARKWKTTATLNSEDLIPIAGMSADRPTEPKYSDALVEAVAWFYTEGSLVAGSSGVIYQKHGTLNAERIRACLSALYGPPVEQFQRTSTATDGTPMWRENLNRHLCEFRLNRDAGPVLLEHAPDRVPSHQFLMSLTQAQLELFVEVSLLADNCGPGKFAQKRPEQAEAFAFGAILAGHAVSIRPHRTPGRDYDMTLVQLMKKRQIGPVKASRQKDAKLKIEQVEHDGIVWCPTVENSTWLARREGSVYFTGNCGVIDEIDSHKVTKEKDYAEQGFTTIYSRMTSRFGDRGFVFCVGQTKYEGSFASRHYEEMKEDPDSYAVKLALWDSIGWENFQLPDGTRNSFYYDVRRKKMITKDMGDIMGGTDEGAHLIEVPNAYRKDFDNNPEKALRDLAGIPPATKSPFISLDYKIEESRDLWKGIAMETWGTDEDPVDPDGRIERWFSAPNSVPRACHIDIGVTNDALGVAIGHTSGTVDVNGEEKPLIVIDMVYRVVAPPGGQIELSTIRHLLYRLRDDLNFRFKLITLDSYQSTDMMQQLRRGRFRTDLLSVDKSVVPYYDLREALYDGRLALPTVLSRLRPTDPPIDILRKELVELQDLGLKIDHPPQGSKDVADAVAGVVTMLMAKGRRASGTADGVPIVIPQRDSGMSSHRAVRSPRADSASVTPVPWRPTVRRGGR